MQLDQAKLRSGVAVPMVAVISNPKSTVNSMGMEAVRAIVSQAPNVVHFELSDMGSIDEALQLFARANPSLLVINGGDGTVGAVLAALLYRNPFAITPPIAVMPGGQTNMTAADLGYRDRPEKILRRLLGLAKSGEIADMLTARNLIEVDLNDGSTPRVGTFFGAAGIVKAIHWCRANGYANGMPNGVAHFLSFIVVAMSLMGIGPKKDLGRSRLMTLRTPDGQAISGEFSVVLATTLDRLLLGLKPFASSGYGGLKLTSVNAGTRSLLRALKTVFTGKWRTVPEKGLHSLRTSIIDIEGDEPVTLDGEMIAPVAGKPLTLRGDKQLTFVRL